MRFAKQPNGKYCIWKSDGKVLINQTEEDYLTVAKEEATKRLHDPGYIEGTDFIIKNITDDKSLKEMGFTKSHSQLMKYIPAPVINKSYSPRDCETVGKCPDCKRLVYDGIGGRQLVCPACGKALDWR